MSHNLTKDDEAHTHINVHFKSRWGPNKDEDEFFYKLQNPWYIEINSVSLLLYKGNASDKLEASIVRIHIWC